MTTSENWRQGCWPVIGAVRTQTLTELWFRAFKFGLKAFNLGLEALKPS